MNTVGVTFKKITGRAFIHSSVANTQYINTLLQSDVLSPTPLNLNV